MKKHSLCEECFEFTSKQCGGRPANIMPLNKLPCKNYELDPQLISQHDIEPGDKPPSLKDCKPDKVKPLIPAATWPTSGKKAANFERLAVKRLSVLLDGFRRLSNLSNKANYEWTQEQVDVMLSRIRGAAEDLEKKFQK